MTAYYWKSDSELSQYYSPFGLRLTKNTTQNKMISPPGNHIFLIFIYCTEVLHINKQSKAKYTYVTWWKLEISFEYYCKKFSKSSIYNFVISDSFKFQLLFASLFCFTLFANMCFLRTVYELRNTYGYLLLKSFSFMRCFWSILTRTDYNGLDVDDLDIYGYL